MPKSKKKIHYLYKTKNILNNKYYIGIHSTNDINDGYLGSGKVLTYAIRKYGKQNFVKEILEFFDDRKKLAEAEKIMITKDILQDKYCYNCMFGGEYFNTSGMVTIKDKDGNIFNVFVDDERYLSGELVHNCKGQITVKDNNNNILSVNINDERYLSGELVGKNKNKVNVKDKDDNKFQVNIDDERYLSGELVSIWKNKKHAQESKDKIGLANIIKQKGQNNSQFGTCWIMNDTESIKIKKEELENYLTLGWIKGRKIK